MEDEDGYMSIDPARRDVYLSPPQETKDLPSNLLWWKIGLGVSLAGFVALTVVLIVLSLSGVQDSLQMDSHPVLFPARLCGSKNSSVLQSLYQLPKYNSCTSNEASCASVPSEICIEIPKSPLSVVANETAIIPIKIQLPKPDWDFIEVLWHHTQGTPEDLILKYSLRSCSPKSKPQLWYKRECHLFLEIMPAHRWKMSAMMNAWLIIWNIEAKHAGRYQVTVKSNNMKEACSFVELKVTEAKT
ncbi:uncharacterized protein LOC129329015 isoform X2 [Eublepharis macularius]|uniref:Uncharacterized protein LOC129329015 isoform X2 n=1 Tax=Eublepharis macularius TaxID=481883 RepID=A0AA97JBB4_EUBMA|nr:uncharacterized protein LOC129329015 isoform X2 [Eublepharis macularius]